MKAKNVLTFDEERHLYLLDGVPIPSVTQVLKRRGLTSSYAGVDPDILKRAQQRGTAVHKAIELHCLGTLDPESIDPLIQPYFDGFLAFQKHEQFQCVHTELQLHSPTWRYAGTIDAVGWLRGQFVLIDFKTTRIPDIEGTKLQLAAYRQMWNEHHPETPVADTFAVFLTSKSSYTAELCSDPDAWRIFSYALLLTQWSDERGRETE